MSEFVAKIRERRLLKEEDQLRRGTLVVGLTMTTDQKLPPVARELAKGKGNLTPEEQKQLLYDAYAELYIPEDAPDFMRMRRIFSRGTYQLFQNKSLKPLAEEEQLTWGDYVDKYRTACKLVSDNQVDSFLKK